MRSLIFASLFALLSLVPGSIFAQGGGLGVGSNSTGEFPVTTAVPFLRIAPDARSGAMGDVGIALKPNANAMHHNIGKLAMAEKPIGVSLSYVPWLRALVNDIYLAHASAYYKLDDVQALGMSLRYFSLGNITFTNVQGEETGDFRPNEFALDFGYSRKLVKGSSPSEGLSVGMALRFIYSNLAAGQTVNGVDIQPGIAASADIGFYWAKDFEIKGIENSQLAIGLNLSNLGSKITYTESAERDFIPMNFGLGTRYTVDIDEYNQLSLAIDMNKLMVPTPTTEDSDSSGVLDYREKSVPAGLFTSWGDAPGGFAEEMREITWSIGLEYWYNQLFAVRAGYFHEHPNKGARQFVSAGIGLRYSVFGLDFSYLIPTTAVRNPLDNTLRFTLIFNFDRNNGDEEEEAPEGATSSIRGF